MKHLTFLTAAAVVGMSLVGCTRGSTAAARTVLDCPARQGDLARTAVAADGRSCRYADHQGDEVSLQLVPVASTPEAALAPIEQSLEAQTATPQAASSGAASGGNASARAAADEADADAAAAGAAAGAGHVVVDNDQANISLPGLHIHADGDRADVRVGSIHVDAGDDGAVVREGHNVRLRGEAFARERRGYRGTFVVARDGLPGGYASFGYEAGGPRQGPLAVAVIKAKSGRHDEVAAEARKLVRLNGGV